MGVDRVVSGTSNEFACFLVVGEGHGESGGEVAAAVLSASVIGCHIFEGRLVVGIDMMGSAESVVCGSDGEEDNKEIFEHYYYNRLYLYPQVQSSLKEYLDKYFHYLSKAGIHHCFMISLSSMVE